MEAESKRPATIYMVVSIVLVFLVAAVSAAMMLPSSSGELTSREGMTYSLTGRKDIDVAFIAGTPDRKLQGASKCQVTWYFDNPKTRENWRAEQDTLMMVEFSECIVRRVVFWPK